MAKKKMRKFLRKPSKETRKRKNWSSLYHKAIEVTKELDNSDPRIKLLKAGKDEPEKTLRRLSIISETDIEREFGSGE